MKWTSGPWGIQILAETDDDAQVLQALLDRQPVYTDNGYTDGGMHVVQPVSMVLMVGGFSSAEVQSARLVVEFLW